jgi:hypothetical protein
VGRAELMFWSFVDKVVELIGRILKKRERE